MPFRIQPVISDPVLTGAFIFSPAPSVPATPYYTVEREHTQNTMLGARGWAVTPKQMKPRRVLRQHDELWVFFGPEVSSYVANDSAVTIRVVDTDICESAIWPAMARGAAPRVQRDTEEDAWQTEFVGFERATPAVAQPAVRDTAPPPRAAADIHLHEGLRISDPRKDKDGRAALSTAQTNAVTKPPATSAHKLPRVAIAAVVMTAVVGGAAFFALHVPKATPQMILPTDSSARVPGTGGGPDSAPAQDNMSVEALLAHGGPADWLAQANRRLAARPDDARRLLESAIAQGYGPAMGRKAELIDPSEPAATGFDKDAGAAITLYDQATLHGADQTPNLDRLQTWLGDSHNISDDVTRCTRWPSAQGCGH